jgi:hypothetical protein
MAQDYVSVKMLREAKIAIEKVRLRHEPLSETIIRVCTEGGASDNTVKQEQSSDDLKGRIEALESKIAELKDSLPSMITMAVNQTYTDDHAKPTQVPVKEPDSSPTDGERCKLTELEKDMYQAICECGIKKEGSEQKFSDRLGLKTRGAVSKLKDKKSDTISLTLKGVLEVYAHSNCPDVLDK